MLTSIFTIIPATQFKTIPWKNGKGDTIELAINEGGCLNDFQWRLSMASVVEDGVFSDFTGYQRNLILIKGEGIELVHDDKVTDKLTHLLSMATFDGSCKTFGKLINNPIVDFNIMTNKESHQVIVNTYIENTTASLPTNTLCFIYALDNNVQVTSKSDTADNKMNIVLPAGDIGKLAATNKKTITVSGNKMIVISLQEK